MSKNTKSASAASVAVTATESAEVQPSVEATAAPADPFADVPVTMVGDEVSFRDFTDVPTSNPYKYAQVDATARAQRLPMKADYKHGNKMITQGTNRKEFKAGSVYGTIQAIGNAAGRAGTPVYVLLTQLRQAQIGNKRSKYCEQLPPIGWAEGWLDTAITKNIVGIHASKMAPALGAEAPAAAEGDEEQKLVANG